MVDRAMAAYSQRFAVHERKRWDRIRFGVRIRFPPDSRRCWLAKQSDSLQQPRSLRWQPRPTSAKPGTRASWSAKNHRSSPRISGRSVSTCKTAMRFVTWPCSTWPSIAELRGCDLVSLHVHDVTHSNQILPRAMVIQSKTQQPVQFELTGPARTAVSAWIEKAHLRSDQYLFPSRVVRSPHVSTGQYARVNSDRHDPASGQSARSSS